MSDHAALAVVGAILVAAWFVGTSLGRVADAIVKAARLYAKGEE